MNESPALNDSPIRTRATVIDNRADGGGGFCLTLSVPGWPGALPGQFVMLSAGPCTSVERWDPLLPRPMAIYRGHQPAPAGGIAEIQVLYKATGAGTRLLAEALPGQSVRVVGPLGVGFPPPNPGQRVCLVGGGSGTASLYEWAVQCARTQPVSVLLGARRAQELIGLKDFEALSVDLRCATEDGSLGTAGRVTALLEPLLVDVKPDEISLYVCGPTPMMRACSSIASRAGIRCIVSLENNMACGFGVCLGCAVPLAKGGFSLVCKAGPVYDAGDVDWGGLP